MSATCPCRCHPHTQWGEDGTAAQRENHPDCDCTCCAPLQAPPLSNLSFFATEQEAVAEEAAWAEQMESEGALVPVVAEDDEEDAPVNPLDIPDEYDLPMHGSILNCPKCGGEKVKTEWHQHGVLSEPCGTRFGWPQVQNLGEHLCRTCVRCKYGWPEEVFSGA